MRMPSLIIMLGLRYPVAKLIVYDSVTQVSQPGTFLGSQQRFEREIEIAKFTVENDEFAGSCRAKLPVHKWL